MGKKGGAAKGAPPLSTLATGGTLAPESAFSFLAADPAADKDDLLPPPLLLGPKAAKPRHFTASQRLPVDVISAVETDDEAGVWHWLDASEDNSIDATHDSGDGQYRGYTMLMLAALCGHEKLVHELVTRGADVHVTVFHGDGVTPRGITALTLASATGRHAVRRRLLSAGAQPTAVRSLEGDVLEFGTRDAALTRLHFRTQRSLEQPLVLRGAPKAAAAEALPDAIIDAAGAGELEAVLAWVDERQAKRVDAQWRETATLLQLACERGDEKLATAMLSRGADTSVCGRGHTPHAIAQRRRHHDLLKLLVEHDTERALESERAREKEREKEREAQGGATRVVLGAELIAVGEETNRLLEVSGGAGAGG